MHSPVSELPTIGSIAKQLGVSTHQIDYIIASRDIKPLGWAGNARVFSDAAVQRIKSELNRIAEDREGR